MKIPVLLLIIYGVVGMLAWAITIYLLGRILRWAVLGF